MATTDERIEALAKSISVDKWQIEKIDPREVPFYNIQESQMCGAECFKASVNTENESQESYWIVASDQEAEELTKVAVFASLGYDTLDCVTASGGIMGKMAPVCRELRQVGVDLLVNGVMYGALNGAMSIIIENHYPGGMKAYTEEAIQSRGRDYFLSQYGDEGRPLGNGLTAYRV
jgi:hypothetical protein